MINKEIELLVKKDILKLVELPENGIMAGQFLASLFFKHLNIPLNQPLNDIDIFTHGETRVNPSNTFRSFFNFGRITSKVPSAFKENVGFTTHRGYSIINSRMYDNKQSDIPINIIKTQSSHFYNENSYVEDIGETKDIFKSRKDKEKEDKHITADTIIHNFDLNCCGVGYDIKNDTFHYTNAFLVFLKDFKLRITSLHSPHSTLLRLFKKTKELNCNPDIEDEINLILIYSFVKNGYRRGRYYYIGKPFYKTFEKHGNELTTELFQIQDNRSLKIDAVSYFNKNKENEALKDRLLKQFNITGNLLSEFHDFAFLNLYYSSIGVLDYYEENIVFFKEHFDSNLEKHNLVYSWYLKEISAKPFQSVNLKKIDESLKEAKLLEGYGHLILSIFGYLEKPEDMNEAAKYFISDGKVDRLKLMAYKNDYTKLYDVCDLSHLNIKPNPIFNVIDTPEKAIYFETKYACDFYKQIHAMEKEELKPFFIMDIFKKPIVFIKKENKENDFFCKFYSGRNKNYKKEDFNYDFNFKNFRLDSFFTDYRFIRILSFEEHLDIYTTVNKNNYSWFYVFALVLCLRLNKQEGISKEDRKKRFSKHISKIKYIFKYNRTRLKRIYYIHPSKITTTVRRYFRI